MIRITKFTQGGQFYGCELPENGINAMEEINILAKEGTPVIIVSDLDDLEHALGITSDEVEMVEREDG